MRVQIEVRTGMGTDRGRSQSRCQTGGMPVPQGRGAMIGSHELLMALPIAYDCTYDWVPRIAHGQPGHNAEVAILGDGDRLAIFILGSI